MNGDAQRRESVLHIAVDHPAFAGHFPGTPMLPGALLAALVIEALGETLDETPEGPPPPGRPLQIDELKWLAPVRPGARLCIALWPLRGGIAFEVRDGAAVAARGRLSGTDAR